MAGPDERRLPFTIEARGPVVLVHRFDQDLDRCFADLERELPLLRDAVLERFDRGATRFVFDVRDGEPFLVYPIAKWGALYGFALPLRRRRPEPRPDWAEWSRIVRQAVGIVVAREEPCAELRGMRFDELFGPCATVAGVESALARGATGAPPRG